ncbi:MAG TPA: DMT family transporter, partial [Anaerolineaceae bacterium]|nr:DMT family transporter [Anaerolineaceae bacterium]
GIATGALLLLMALFRRKSFYIYPVGLAGCVLAGLVNGIGSIFYYSALGRIDASIGHLLYSFYPLFVAIWLLLDRYPINRLTIFRLALSIPGMVLLVSAGHTTVDLIGAGFMLLSAVLYALHVIINQRVLYEVPAPTVTLYTLMSMTLTVFIAFLVFRPQLPPSDASWWPVLGMALITFLSRLTLFFGIKHLGGLQTALLGISELLITVVLAQRWLGETMSPLQWVGAGFVFASLVLVGFDRFTPEKRHGAGMLAWLNPPKIPTSDVPWHSQP